MNGCSLYSFFLIILCTLNCAPQTAAEKKIGKKLTDYNDVDMERLLDQWNVSFSRHLILAFLVLALP
jgi:hypothetical protein